MVVDLVLEAGLLHLELANLGAQPARNVTCRFDRPLADLSGRDVGELALFKHMPFLMPGKRIRTLLGRAAAFCTTEGPTTVAITVDYDDNRGIRRTASVEHDFSVYRDLITSID